MLVWFLTSIFLYRSKLECKNPTMPTLPQRRQMFILSMKLSNSYGSPLIYCKVVSTRPPCLEAHRGLFRLSKKGKFDGYLQWPFGKKLISKWLTFINTHNLLWFRLWVLRYFEKIIFCHCTILLQKLAISKMKISSIFCQTGPIEESKYIGLQ